jgi:hypothetical protein
VAVRRVALPADLRAFFFAMVNLPSPGCWGMGPEHLLVRANTGA